MQSDCQWTCSFRKAHAVTTQPSLQSGCAQVFSAIGRLRCSLFRRLCTIEKSFASTGITPLISLPPALPAKRGEQGEMGGGVGGRQSRPPTPRPLDSPSPLERKIFRPNGEGAGSGAMRLQKCTRCAEKLAPKLECTRRRARHLPNSALFAIIILVTGRSAAR